MSVDEDTRTITLFSLTDRDADVEEVTIGYLKAILASVDPEYDHLPVVLATEPNWDLVPALAGILLPKYGVLCLSGSKAEEGEEEESDDEDIHAEVTEEDVIEGEFSVVEWEDIPESPPDGTEAAA